MKKLILPTLIYFALLGMILYFIPQRPVLSGTPQSLPNPLLTPGKADTLDTKALLASYGGQTYSQAHRAVSSGEKAAVCKEYPQNCKGEKEIDHLYPLCAGGSNDITNLWAEPGTGEWNFHDKDKLEAEICRRIKAGTLDPHMAYQKITTNWIAYYQEMFGVQKFGGVVDEDDK